MNQNIYAVDRYLKARLQELARETQPTVSYDQVKTRIRRQFRQRAGEALIALGTWVKSGTQSTKLSPAHENSR
jgi:hypothetical protein